MLINHQGHWQWHISTGYVSLSISNDGLLLVTPVFFTNQVKASHIGSPDWWVCCFETNVSGCTWAMTPVVEDPNITAFLAPVLFNLYSNDLPVTHGRKFIYADDMSRHSRPILQRT